MSSHQESKEKWVNKSIQGLGFCTEWFTLTFVAEISAVGKNRTKFLVGIGEGSLVFSVQ